MCKTTNLAIHINNLRVIPRLLLLAQWHLTWHMVNWYEHLPNPSMNQTTFTSIIVGMLPVLVGFYLKSGGIEKIDPDK